MGIPVVDANTAVGPWPFRYLRNCHPSQLWHRMCRAGVGRAIVTANEAVFYKDCGRCNPDLVGLLEPWAGRLLPAATINPSFPGWQQDLDAAIEAGIYAVRLLPNYHGYSLDDSRLAAFIQEMERAGRPLLVPIRLEDERHHHWLCKVPNLEASDLASFVAAAEVPVLVTNGRLADYLCLIDHASGVENLYLDTAYVNGPDGAIEQLVERVGPGRVLFGSWMPFLYLEPQMEQLRALDLSMDEQRRIAYVNAEELFGLQLFPSIKGEPTRGSE